MAERLLDISDFEFALLIDLVDLRFTRDELRRELSIDLVLPAVATESDQGRFLINFLTLLMTLFLMMNMRNIMSPLRALIISSMKTNGWSVCPIAPVIESATQGSPMPKKSQTMILNLCVNGLLILSLAEFHTPKTSAQEARLKKITLSVSRIMTGIWK